MAQDLKATSPDKSLPVGAFLFGADSQSASDAAVYPTDRFQRALCSGGHVGVINPRPGQNNFDVNGTNGTINPGTGTARTLDDGNLYTSLARLGIASAASAGSSAQLRTNSGVTHVLRGAAAGRCGFRCQGRFGVGDAAAVANARMFVGLAAVTTSIANADPSSFTNIFGVGCDAGETAMSMLHNDAAGAATKTGLGTDYPTDTIATDVYCFTCWCDGGASEINWLLERFTADALTPAFSTGGAVSSDIPASATGLQFHLWRNNGATALAVMLDIFGYEEWLGAGAAY